MKYRIFHHPLSLTTVSLSAVAVAATILLSGPSAPGAPPNVIKVGQHAPDFTLQDVTGKSVTLSQFKGKIVVLEWFNPECPFVKLAHSRDLSLKESARKHKKNGVVWLAVNSNGPGEQGHGPSLNEKGKAQLKMDYPILLDPTGKVGKLYGAVRTPELFVIDEKGVLTYRGAIDNTQGGDPSDAEPPPAKNYVDEVLNALYKKQPPPIQETTPWGCTVKYAK